MESKAFMNTVTWFQFVDAERISEVGRGSIFDSESGLAKLNAQVEEWIKQSDK